MARITRIASAVPDLDFEQDYRRWASARLAGTREARVYARMAERSGIEHRWSVLTPEDARLAEGKGMYGSAEQPGTAQRMAIYAEEAPKLALKAIGKLGDLGRISHLVVASCTGFVAPGIDQIIARRLDLGAAVERVLIGFMGCYAAVTALRTARHIVRSEPAARVLVVTVELSSLHHQEDTSIEPLLARAQFGDGAAAALVTAEGEGLAIGEGLSVTLEESDELITWHIGDTGFRMHLSGEVPGRIAAALARPEVRDRIFAGQATDAYAIHAGGRSILDAVERALELAPDALDASRTVLREFGNMSSSTLMFVLERLLRQRPARGVALAFGPGLAMEGFRFGWEAA
ncbi:type III polyketide synthase [Porphyrobacter sp. GA68]|uniref:type III polyketide synthase n=1 Tax=Porphyrobacter sp. GA68 TaxID=2883480 RepID=UPI001D17FEE8|nr:type III polyketide synthase [Porphyrobacter sp. GA68]